MPLGRALREQRLPQPESALVDGDDTEPSRRSVAEPYVNEVPEPAAQSRAGRAVQGDGIATEVQQRSFRDAGVEHLLRVFAGQD